MAVFLTSSYNTLEALVSAPNQGLNPWYFPRMGEYLALLEEGQFQFEVG